MDKSGARIRRMFDEISPTYDLLNHVLSLNTDVAWRRLAAKAAVPNGGGVVLDVCCGTGDLALALAQLGARVIGTDFALRMLQIATRKIDTIAAADTLRLPFPDGQFDASTVAFGLRNTEDPRRALSEMARVVRPGGRVVVLEFVRPPNPIVRFYTECVLPIIGDLVSRSKSHAYTYLPRSVGKWHTVQTLARELERAGLQDVRTQRLSMGIAVIHTGITK